MVSHRHIHLLHFHQPTVIFSHLTAAFRLMTFGSEKGMDLIHGGLVVGQSFVSDALNQALLAMSALDFLLAHFESVSSGWNGKFINTGKEILRNQSQQRLRISQKKVPKSEFHHLGGV